MNVDAALTASVVAALGVVGAGLKWTYSSLTGRIDKRQDYLDERDRVRTADTDKRILALENQLARMADELERLRNENMLLRIHIARIDPNAPILMAASLVGVPLDQLPGAAELVAKLKELP